jgi:heme/copper-type cytochrome/quinol oxidase subunit 1
MTSSLSEHGPIRGNVFTEPLLRNGFGNAVVPPLLGADDIEKAASSIVACWIVFTKQLRGNALIKSVKIYCQRDLLHWILCVFAEIFNAKI